MAFGTRSGGLGFFGRLKTGWILTKDSFAVIRDYPKLMVFPLLAALSSVVFFVAFFLPMVIAGVFSETLALGVLFALYFATTFASTYFTAALVYASNEAFHDREPSVRESMRAVNGRLGPILVWSLIAATVSVILRSLENSDSPVARIIASLFALGWSILTFFVVPVIVFEEDVTAKSMFTKSGSTFKDTWGETLGAGFGISAIMIGVGLLLVLGAVLLAAPIAAIFPGPGIILGVVLVLLAMSFAYLLSQTVWGVAKTALYVYAREGITPSQFENFDLETLGGRTEMQQERSAPAGRGIVDNR